MNKSRSCCCPSRVMNWCACCGLYHSYTILHMTTELGLAKPMCCNKKWKHKAGNRASMRLVRTYVPSSSITVTLAVLPDVRTMSLGLVGCIVTRNVSFPSTESSPMMVIAATQTPSPCSVVEGMTTSLSSSTKSVVAVVYVQDQYFKCNGSTLVCFVP